MRHGACIRHAKRFFDGFKTLTRRARAKGLRPQNTKRGGAASAYADPKTKVLFACWRSMRDRCFNRNNPSFSYYGGRGITVCPEWNDSFDAFYRDMEATWKLGLTIDRYPDNNGNYEPGNVRWATRLEQRLNQRPYKRKQAVKVAPRKRIQNFSDEELKAEIARRESVRNSNPVDEGIPF
jgi:hypothetical protein